MNIECHEFGVGLGLGGAVEGAGEWRLVISDDYLSPEVRHLCHGDRPVLLVRTDGSRLWIGPLIGMEGSICYDCLSFYMRLRGGRRGDRCEYPEAAIAILKTYLDGRTCLRRAISVVEPLTGEGERVALRSRGDCTACAGAPLDLSQNLTILSHPLTGILHRARIEPVPKTGLYVSVGPVRMPEEVRIDRRDPLWAGGRGRTREQARLALTLEAAERYSVLFDGTERLLLGTVGRLAAFPPEQLLQFSAAQYSGERRDVKRLVPEQEILWAPARSLADAREVPVPAGCVYLEYLYEIEPRYNLEDTNGCAAGETIDRSIERALLELIERDALAIWWYNQIERSEVLFVEGELAARDEALESLAEDGRQLHLFDVTTDVDVPVVAAVSCRQDGSSVYLGAAADLSIEQAARRAIEELIQFWHFDRIQNYVPESRALWIREGSCQRYPFLSPRQKAVPRHRPCPSVVGALRARGFDPLWVDLTRPALEVPVARAIVPGLRHPGRRLAPGRLFDLPVKLGWRARALDEAEMHPYPPPL